MSEVIIATLLITAAVLVLLAAIGLLRLPDLPTRMHATTKSGVLAIILVMVAVGVFYARVDVAARVIAIIVFTLVTAPIAAHAIGRAAYFAGVPLWDKTIKDDLKQHYKKSKKIKHGLHKKDKQ